MSLVRLNKYLAERGVASRRASDKLIDEGRVMVNGTKVTELGVKVDPEKDKVRVDGTVIGKPEKSVYLALNKPIGYVVSAKKTDAEPNIVLDLISIPERVFPVGRLDKDTSGLLILTNDGDLALRLSHPSFESEKEYEVTVENRITPEIVHKLEAGVVLWGVRTNPAKVEVLGHNRMKLTITEGKNRQIRRICQKVGIPVAELRRIRVKSIRLGNLREGQWRYLTAQEVASLKQ